MEGYIVRHEIKGTILSSREKLNTKRSLQQLQKMLSPPKLELDHGLWARLKLNK